MSLNTSRQRLMGWPEFITGLIIWFIVVIIIYTTRNMDFWASDNTPGPRFLPLIVAVSLSALAVLYWFEAYKNREQGIRLPSCGKLIKPAGFVAVSFLIIPLWDWIGAIPVVMLVSFLEFKLLEKYAWKRSLIAAVIMSAFTYVLFEIVLGISLPRGIFK